MFKRFSLLLMILASSTVFSIECYKSCDPEGDRDFFYQGCRIVGDAEFLYWKASVNAVDYTLKLTEEIDTNCAVGDFKSAKYDYKPGVRAGLRYHNGPRFWEASVHYTWLYTNGSDNVEDNVYGLIRPFTDYINADIVVKAESDIKLWYNLLDVMAARVFDPNPHLRMRALSGLTGAWITQKWKVDYTQIDNEQSHLKHKWLYRAIGYRAGASFDWYWWCDFYMTGKATLALTVGKYINTAKVFSEMRENLNQAYRDTRYEDYRLATHFQMFLGPSYQKLWNCYDFEFFIGYEFNAWSNLHEVFSCQDVSGGNYSRTLINNGLLGLHGLSMRLTVAY